MALGTNYKRIASGIYDLATCYKMAVVGKDKEKKAKFKAGIEAFSHASDAIRAKVLRDCANFERNYKPE